MPKRKKGQPGEGEDEDDTSFHPDFRVPTDHDRITALGPFPSNLPQPKTLRHSPDLKCLSLEDLNDRLLYQPAGQVNQKISKPRDTLDWLAQVPEEDQTLEEYVGFLTSRSGKRLRPIANPAGITICLLSIVTDEWDERAPNLQSLARMTEAFFQRPVTVLRSAVISSGSATSSRRASAAAKFHIQMYNQEGIQTLKGSLVGRHNSKTNKNQFQVESLLDQLSSFRENCHQDDNNFCITGVTLEDLYDGQEDLFCAGMAFGGSKVAVFLFHRYHPHMKMSSETWWDYGYTPKQPITDNYAYFEVGEKPANLAPAPPSAMWQALQIEWTRRGCKLLLHELGHLYGLDHCIYHRCLMNGTGHLVEDFAAPSHACAICLRKLQWRLGFRVEARYQQLGQVMQDLKFTREARWTHQQLRLIQKKRQTVIPQLDKHSS